MPLVSAAAQKRCVKTAGTRMDVCRFVTAHRFCCPCALLYVARKGMCARETLVGLPLRVKSSARRRPLLRSKSACTKKEGHPYGCPSFLVPMFITTLSQTRMKSRLLAADEYISPKKSNSVGVSWLKPSRKIAHLRLSSPPYIMEAQRRQAR